MSKDEKELLYQLGPGAPTDPLEKISLMTEYINDFLQEFTEKITGKFIKSVKDSTSALTEE